ncbi:hypothetical protein A2U01_0007359 [Trifolium medium]|uniref:Uncharacterized protein n=1 Tax=Trifolium medium TaxID=97028 RepID=A0A392MG79_9FABA|nr:hypothetical protein [Trifolium medium]
MLAVVPLSNRPDIMFLFQAFTLCSSRSCTLIAATAGCRSSGLDREMPPGANFAPRLVFSLLYQCSTYNSLHHGASFKCTCFRICNVIKLALYKGNVDKKEALENLNLIVLCINELILRVDSS